MQTAQQVVETVLAGLGYELVDLEWPGGGLLRVFIDRPESADGVAVPIAIEDCERVSNQLSHVLTVENVNFERLEISSPGLDRPLKKAADFVRFAGAEVVVKLRMPFEGRKNFQGVLRPADALEDDAPSRDIETFGLVFDGKDGTEQVLRFTLAELDRARLVPQIDFRSRKK